MKLRILARLRLARIQEKSTNRKTFRNTLYKALKSKGLTDLEISMTLKELTEMHASDVYEKMQRLEREHLETERANDYIRLTVV